MRHQLKHLAKSKAVKRSFNVNDEEAQILADEIDRADVNKDGTITMDEMTPTLDRFAKRRKFQPSAGGTTNKHIILNIQQKMLEICQMMNF